MGVVSGLQASPDADPFIRVGEVLSTRRNNFPSGDVLLLDEVESPDDCRIVRPEDLQQFHISGPARYARYDDIQQAFARRRASGSQSHSAAYKRETVFAPASVLVSDSGLPIRSAICFEPVYPQRAKLASLRDDSSLWMAYAAVGMLNSALGQAHYRRACLESGRSLASNQGLATSILKDIPLARRDADPQLVRQAARLAYQVGTISMAGEECGALDAQLRDTRGHLLHALVRLLGLAEVEAQQLSESVRDLNPPDYPSYIHPSLFDEPREIPVYPPVRLLSTEEQSTLASALFWSDHPEPGAQHAELERLKRLQWWEGVLHTEPPYTIERANLPETDPGMAAAFGEPTTLPLPGLL